MNEIELTHYTPADHTWLVERHQTLYRLNDEFDDSFGPLVNDILKDFEANSDPSCEMGWIARDKDGLRLGSIFCVKLDDQTAKLRLFMCLPEARGLGLGKRLLTHRMAFAKAQGFQRMTLWTYESHEAARPLYTRTGWACVSSKPVHSFGVSLTKQQWEITL